MTVTNHTTHDLTIRLGGSRLADVPAGDSGEVSVAPRGECVNTDGSINAITDDGSMVAALAASPNGEVCEGDTWVVEQSDLLPIEDTIYAPSS
ncbi:hypothetical protein OEB99_18270 [Actinotalea sp. M2MS4P-6]|nr:hypothetical protein [Actinotalea sp. M2MS4P-6]